MYRQDWLMTQVEMFGKMLAKLLFAKDSTMYLPPEKDAASHPSVNLLKQLDLLLADGKLRQAKDFFDRETEQVDRSDRSFLELSIDFFDRLNRYDDAQLEAQGIEREELSRDFKAFVSSYGIEIPGF